MSLDNINCFLEPVNLAILSDDEGFFDTQLGKHISAYEEFLPDITESDLVIVGCSETRGNGPGCNQDTTPDDVRKEIYRLFYWHNTINISDIGNVKKGASIEDTYAALKSVVSELVEQGKKVLIIGGSHDLTLAQYGAYVSIEKIIEATCVDAKIDLNMDTGLPSDNYLMEMLTGEPNFIKHYNHIGFQSYFVHPHMLETIDKLRFDCYRVGKVKESIEEMEPAIRNSHMLSFDISAIQNAHAPANRISPNGFTGEEACTLMKYAGMSPNISSIGIYGFLSSQDVYSLTSKQISQMVWYLIDGIYKGKNEAMPAENDSFNVYSVIGDEYETKFLQNKQTGRWWMQTYEGKYTACTYADYLIASKNEIPERWLRALERSI